MVIITIVIMIIMIMSWFIAPISMVYGTDYALITVGNDN